MIYKQLADYRSRKRLSGVMEGMAKALSVKDFRLMSRAITRGVRAGCRRWSECVFQKPGGGFGRAILRSAWCRRVNRMSKRSGSISTAD